jgi:hypothetical protein
MANVQKTFRITKVAEDTKVAYGFAYVSKKGGEPVVDHSKQIWGIDEVRKTAHQFVTDCRIGAESHDSETQGAAELVESLVFDQDVQDALGIELMKDGEPIEAWFIGMRINDPDLLEKVQKGLKGEKGGLSMFSIGGTGKVEAL